MQTNSGNQIPNLMLCSKLNKNVYWCLNELNNLWINTLIPGYNKEPSEKFMNGEIVTLDLDEGIIFKGIPNN